MTIFLLKKISSLHSSLSYQKTKINLCDKKRKKYSKFKFKIIEA